MNLSPEQQALITLAQLRDPGSRGIQKPDTPTPGPVRADDWLPAALGEDSNPFAKWDRAQAAGKPDTVTLQDVGKRVHWKKPEPEPRPILPKVDMATAMAVAADKARTGKSLADLYKDRGYAIATDTEDDATRFAKYISNLRMRGMGAWHTGQGQGDLSALGALQRMAPDESPWALLSGNTAMEREARAMEMIKKIQEQARADQQAAAEQERADRQAEASNQRNHSLALLGQQQSGAKELQQMIIDSQKAQAVLDDQYRNRMISLEEKKAAELAIANKFARELQERMFQKQGEQQKQAADRSKGELTPVEQLIVTGSIRDAEAQGGSSYDATLGALNQIGKGPVNPTATPVNQQRPLLPATGEEIASMRQAVLASESPEAAAMKIANLAPQLEGRPALMQQLLQVARMRYPDFDQRLQAVIEHGLDAGSDARIRMSEASALNPLGWGAAIGERWFAPGGIKTPEARRMAKIWATLSDVGK